MKSVFSLLAVLLVAFSSGVAFGIETKREQAFAFEAILSELKTHYGMIKFKERTFGITYDALERKYLRLIDNAMTLEESEGLRPRVRREVLPPDEFRQMMIGFAAEFKDGHTNILRQSRELWTLGIRTAAIQGRLYVVGFNNDFYDLNSTYPRLEIGDEVIEVDGKPVAEIARENELYMSLATKASRKTRALEMILNVPNRWLRAKQTGGQVQVKFARGGAKPKTIEGHYHWLNTKDYSDLASLSLYVTPEKDQAAKEKEKLKTKPYVYGEGSTRATYFTEGLKKMGLPLGSVTDVGKLLNIQIEEEKKKKSAGVDADAALAELEPVERLAAYTIRHEGKTFGVIRMPSYSPDAGFNAAIAELKWLARVVGMMENTTDAMIIDQLSNGGGYVYQFAQFVRLFATEGEMKTNLMDVKLSDTFFAAHNEIPNPENYDKPIEGHNRNYGRMILERDALKKMKEAFDKGEKWSGWVSFMGGAADYLPDEMGKVVAMPDKLYTKPILLLNDGRSASGGDFMPATMQAAKRATIMGETSMGLGGPVYRGQDSMPGSEVFMRCTMGYCMRADGLPIENMGVVPNVRREIEQSDLKDGFATYAKDVLVSAGLLAGGKADTEINSLLQEELAKREAAAFPAASSREFVELNSMLQHFRAGQGVLTGEQFVEGYKALVEQLKKMDLAKIRPEEWRKIEFPIPGALLLKDTLLASMSDKASVLNRLEEMSRHPYFTSKPEVVALIDATRKALSAVGEIRINACTSLLTVR